MVLLTPNELHIPQADCVSYGKTDFMALAEKSKEKMYIYLMGSVNHPPVTGSENASAHPITLVNKTVALANHPLKYFKITIALFYYHIVFCVLVP